MLNYETLLSNYDDRLTLLEYLKKVEAALADASATSFSVTKMGNATLKFVLTFADGSTLESPEIVLQQGESVASAAIAANGHLLLTLTNGDVLDAGSMFDGSVSISGDLSVAGFTQVNNIKANGDVEITGDTEINGALQVNNDITATGDFSAPNITGDSIIENMTGYSFVKQTTAKGTLNYIYAGAVKNGNKLTLVCAFEFTKNTGATGSVTCGRFEIPTSVMSKVYPSIGSSVDIRIVSAFPNNFTSKSVYSAFYKYDGHSLYNSIEEISGLDAEVTYYIRQELTILLSDNLAA